MKYGTMVRLNSPEEAKEKFQILNKYGLTSCQLVYKPEKYTEDAAKKIKAAAEECNIDISAQFCGFNDDFIVWDNYYGFQTSGLNVAQYAQSRIEYVMNAATFASQVGIEDIVIHAGFIPNNPFDDSYFSLLTAVKLICNHCKKLGLNVLLETGGESAVCLLRLITDSGADNLFVNLDPANMIMYGYANPIDALYTIGKYVRNVHGKDGMPPTDPRELGKEVAAGEGYVDFRKMFEKLHELGYDRYVTIEREITGEQQTLDILKAKEYFESLVNEIYN